MQTPGGKGPAVICSLTLEFRSAADAEKVNGSIELDNQGFLETKVVGRNVEARVEADSLKSLLHTLDDLLACVSIAEKIVSGED